jgi:hypothetical protein
MSLRSLQLQDKEDFAIKLLLQQALQQQPPLLPLLLPKDMPQT